MAAEQVITHIRRMLLGLSVLMCLGIVAELLITGHYEAPLQLLPIALCVLALGPLLAVLLRPGRNTFQLLRGVMLVLAAIGGLGVYLHLAGNLTFATEVNADKARAAPARAALTGGNPALAPGALGVIALVALTAVYRAESTGRSGSSGSA